MGQLDRVTWQRTVRVIRRQARRLRKIAGPLKKSRFSDVLIACMYYWSALHDRPLCWAADREHYDRRLFRPRKLPSRSQFCRRVDSSRFDQLLAMIHAELAGPIDPSDGGFLDGKPLVVGVASKDPDAVRGKVMGGYARGYKLHIWSNSARRIVFWSLQPLNVGEQVVGEVLIQQHPGFNAEAICMADGNYDCQRIYEALEAKGGGLLAKPRGMDLQNPEPWLRQQAQLHPKNKGGGPARGRAMQAWRNLAAMARYLYHGRINVEGTLSNLCSYAGGLGPLPSWVRRTTRVRRWVGVKISLYHARLDAMATLAKAA